MDSKISETVKPVTQVNSVTATTKKSVADYGRTVGKPQLSEAAASYYEELKKKFGSLDFVLVSTDQKESAKAMAGSFANPNRTVVLIDEEKIERMASDESFRKQYEGLISQAASGLSQLKSQMASSGQDANVQGYGIQISDNGTAKYFAVLKKSSEAQAQRIEKQLEKSREVKKEEARKDEQAKQEEALAEAGRSHAITKDSWGIDSDSDVIFADSLEELMKKLEAYTQNLKLDSVMTEEEKMVGQHIDFRG